MTVTSKVSWVLGTLVAVTGLLTWASDFENPLKPYIIKVGGQHFAGIGLESKVDEAVTKQSAILSKLDWIEQNEVRKQIYDTRKSQCAAETQFQKDYYHSEMERLRDQYQRLFGYPYQQPACREIL